MRYEPWTPDRLAMAKRLYIDDGRSATETAREIGGTSRNAVIGVAHRHGWVKTGRRPASKPARLAKAPKVKPASVRLAPRPGPQNKPAAVFGDIVTARPGEVDETRAIRAAEGKTLNARVNSGAGVDSPNARPFMDATRGCKWPIGSGMAMLYCCNPVVGGDGLGRNYCAGHRSVAMAPVQPKRIRPNDTAHFTRHERLIPRVIPANDRPQSIWDEGRAA